MPCLTINLPVILTKAILSIQYLKWENGIHISAKAGNTTSHCYVISFNMFHVFCKALFLLNTSYQFSDKDYINIY